MNSITNPDYYLTTNGSQVIDFIDALNLNFNLGNVVKYISRAGKKNGEDTLTALLKARFYLDHEIERLQKGCENIER